MDRAKLKRALGLAAGGLNTDPKSPQPLQCFLLLGDRIIAHNDRVTVRVRLNTGISGGIEGKQLLKLIDSGEGPVDLAVKGNAVRIKSGGNVVSLALLAAGAFAPYGLDKLKAWNGAAPMAAEDRDAFFTALAACLRVVDDNAAMPDRRGITFVPGRDKPTLYAANYANAVAAAVPDIGIEKRVLVPGEFARQAVRIGKDAAKTCLRVSGGQIMLLADDVLLRGALLDTDNPLKFAELMAQYPANELIDLPPPLVEALRYASIVADTGSDQAHATELAISGGKARLTTIVAGRRHDAGAGIALNGHPDVAARINAGMILKACEHYPALRVYDKTTLLHSAAATQIIAHLGG